MVLISLQETEMPGILGTHFPQVVSAVFADFLLRPASGYWP